MYRDFKLALLVLILIAVPTAILSLLAARAFRDWDAVVERQTVAAADHALGVVIADLTDAATRLQEQIIRFADEIQRVPPPAGDDERARRLLAANPLARQLFVGRLDGPWLYPVSPSPPSRPIVSPLKTDHASSLEQAHDLQFRRNDYAGALARYVDLLEGADMPATIRADIMLAAAQCYRRLDRHDQARVILEVLAAGTSVPPTTRNAEGYLYRLTALRELVDMEIDSLDKRSFEAAALALLNAMAEMYPAMTVFQCQSLDTYSDEKLLPRLQATGGSSGLRAQIREAEERLRVARRNRRFYDDAALRIQSFAADRRRAGDDGWRLHGSTQSLWMVRVLRNQRIIGTELDRGWLMQRVLSHAMWPVQLPGDLQISVQYEGRPFVASHAVTPRPSWRRLTERPLFPGQPSLTGSVWMTDPAIMRRGAAIRATLYTWGVVLLSVTVLVGIAITVHYGVAEVRRARLRGDFLAGVSHDLRTPLASMRMLAESLYQDNITDPPTRRRFLEAIVHECTRLGQLTERTLYLVRYGQQALQFKLVDEDLAGLVRETAASFAARFKPGDIDVRVMIEPGLATVRFDGTSIAQVIFNLLENAVKYAPGSPIELDLRAVPGRRQIQIGVRDYGQGVAPHDRRRIFRNYTRGRDSRTGKVAGAGLGLALCRHIIHAHAGRITVEDAPGGGALFRVVLPVQDEE